MMSDISILKEMIKDTATVPLKDDQHGKKQVILEEPPPADYSVTIYGMPDDDQTIIIKADAFPAPQDIFANSKSECKRADFVIISDTGSKKVIVYIEMKAGKGHTEKEIIHQLNGAKCLIAYCREIGQSFWNHNNFLKDYEYRFVSIRKISISKKPTRLPSRTIVHDRPDQMLKITSPKGLQFNKII
jgi:hypothetical protein